MYTVSLLVFFLLDYKSQCNLHLHLGHVSRVNHNYFLVTYHCSDVAPRHFSCLFCHLSLPLTKSWIDVHFVVYDTMGYIQTVNNTADASMLDQIQEVQNTNLYQQRNGAVSRYSKWNIFNYLIHYRYTYTCNCTSPFTDTFTTIIIAI